MVFIGSHRDCEKHWATLLGSVWLGVQGHESVLATFEFLPDPYQRLCDSHDGIPNKMDVNMFQLLWRAITEIAVANARQFVTDDIEFKLHLILRASVAKRIYENSDVKYAS